MIYEKVLGLFSKDLGIDLGTANSLVCVRGEGIVLMEPSVVAVKKGTSQVLNNGQAVGIEAKKMMGKTPINIDAVRPLKDGVIADFEIAEAMISYLINKVQPRRFGMRAHPRVLIAIPSGITAVEKRAVYNSAERAGARKVFLVEEPRAAGIGAGLPIAEPQGSMIVDVGGGTTEVAVLSLADMAASECLRVAGDDFDEAIIAYMRRTYNLMIGELSAERIKMEIGSAYPLEEELTMEVRGRDAIDGLPTKQTVTSEEIREALREPCNAIVEAVRRTLEKTPPELAADLVETGVTLAGGGALLRGLDKLITRETGLHTAVAEDPITCVARGTGIFLENLDLFSDILESSASI
jgi:rod shape-determining protein MreB